MATTKAKRRATTAFHTRVKMPDSSVNVVGFGHLRVLIVKDDGMWFAQCLDINYAAQGQSLAEVKRNFARGLEATVHEHLRVYGHIRNLLSRPPSPRIWHELVDKTPRAFRYSQVTVHRLPKPIQKVILFEGIQFIQPKIAA